MGYIQIDVNIDELDPLLDNLNNLKNDGALDVALQVVRDAAVKQSSGDMAQSLNGVGFYLNMLMKKLDETILKTELWMQNAKDQYITADQAAAGQFEE